MSKYIFEQYTHPKCFQQCSNSVYFTEVTWSISFCLLFTKTSGKAKSKGQTTTFTVKLLYSGVLLVFVAESAFLERRRPLPII